MTTPTAEEQLARALIAVEPPKIEGGSPARAGWLRLCMEAQTYLHENHMDVERFRAALTDG